MTTRLSDILAQIRKVVEEPEPIGTQTHWDNPDNDPNKRKSVGEDPTGESNRIT